MNLSPIILFVYNRPWHTKQTIEALQKNELASKSELFIYSEAPKNKEAKEKVNEVRKYIENINGFKKVTIIEREKNFGLAKNIIDGVTKIVNEYGKVIVLEDDLVTSPYFLRFMNDALEFYKDNKQVWSITGFTYPLKIKNYEFSTYLYPRGSSKSWAIWNDRWNNIEFDEKKIVKKYGLNFIKHKSKPYGKDLYTMFLKQIDKKINSWAVRYVINQIVNETYTVYPVCSYVKDIGDNYGTHANDSLSHKVKICKYYNNSFADSYNEKIANQYKNYLKKYFFKVKIRSAGKKLKRFIFEK